MSKYNIMKAVEYDKLPVKFKKANPFESLMDKGYWMQPKYDGCFGMAKIAERRDECQMLSRTGEDYSVSCAHILDALHGIQDFRDHGDVTILGEVWHETDPFPKISGDFRRGRPSPHLLFVMNDLLLEDTFDVAYSNRLLALTGFTDRAIGWSSPLRMVSRINCDDPTAMALRYKQIGNYDGVILRNPEAGYTIGTVKNGEIIKVKPVLSLDLEVKAINTATGEKTGRLVWTLVVTYNGVETTVGSGVPHTMDVNAVGKIAEIECMGLTEDGKLREPRFKGWRYDKLKAD